MGLSFQPTGSACGARVTGVDLTEPLDEAAKDGSSLEWTAFESR